MIPTEFINSLRIFCYKTVDLLNLYLMYLIITSFHSHETGAYSQDLTGGGGNLVRFSV